MKWDFLALKTARVTNWAPQWRLSNANAVVDIATTNCCILLWQNLPRMIISILLQFCVNVTSFVNSIVPTFRFITQKHECCYDHVEVVQIHTMQSIFLLLQLYNQSIGHKKRTNNLTWLKKKIFKKKFKAFQALPLSSHVLSLLFVCRSTKCRLEESSGHPSKREQRQKVLYDSAGKAIKVK